MSAWGRRAGPEERVFLTDQRAILPAHPVDARGVGDAFADEVVDERVERARVGVLDGASSFHLRHPRGCSDRRPARLQVIAQPESAGIYVEDPFAGSARLIVRRPVASAPGTRHIPESISADAARARR